MDIDKRIELIKEVGEEVLTEQELRELLETKKRPIAYDGFEPSGKIHIAQGLLRAINVNKMTQAGVLFKLFAADWHAWANNKLGGDLEKIQTCGDYMIEVWKACGMDMKNVEFVRASDMVNDPEYWKKVVEISRNTTVKRIVRTGQIMGRKESDVQQASQILYPCMQAADIFWLEADIAQLGMDQRKVNVLAREVGPKLGYWKPIVVSHHMLLGLAKPPAEIAIEDKVLELKMSKSKPETAIFMTDDSDAVLRKMNKAYCPEKQVEGNPVLEYAKHIVFERTKKFTIERPDKFGGDVAFENYAELEKAYVNGDIHPADLKKGVGTALNEQLEPVRKHFSSGKPKKLLETISSYKVTR